MPKWYRCRRGLTLAVLVPGLLTPAASCQDGKQLPGAKNNAPGVKAMIEIVKSTGQADPPKVPYTPSGLTRGAAAARAKAPAQDFVRLYGSPAQNSRTPGSLPKGQWQARWEAPLESPAVTVLSSGDRVLAQRGGGWTLLDRQGKQIASGPGGNAPILLDSSAGMFYSLGTGNTLRSIGMNDGQLRFGVPLGHTEAFAWMLLYRSGKRLVATAAEQKMFAPKVYPPESSLIQVIEVGSPLQLSPYKVLLSVDLQQEMIFKNPAMVAAASGDTIWAALPNLLVRTSPAQEILGSWSDTFEPVQASTDETGRLHLIAQAGGKRELWVVGPDGGRNVRVELKPELTEVLGPPAVGYDHRIYLWTVRDVAAFSPEGQPLWTTAVAGRINGLTVTPDGNVLVSAAGHIYALDGTGKAASLIDVAESFVTAPVLTADGDLLVGTAGKIFCYRAQ